MSQPNLTAMPPPGFEVISAFMLEQLAALLGVAVGEIDPGRDLVEYGVDSVDAVLLSGMLEERLGAAVDPSLLLRNASIAAVLDELTAIGLIEPRP